MKEVSLRVNYVRVGTREKRVTGKQPLSNKISCASRFQLVVKDTTSPRFPNLKLLNFSVHSTWVSKHSILFQ